MWHPAQAASQSVAILTFDIIPTPILPQIGTGHVAQLFQRIGWRRAQYLGQEPQDLPIGLGRALGYYGPAGMAHLALKVGKRAAPL
jgi:hypothetical protein